MASTLLYAINGTIDYIVIKNAGLGLAMLSIALGIGLGVAVVGKPARLRFRLRLRNDYYLGAFSALAVVGYSVILFFAYTKYTLASIYPLIGLSALVFFLIDYFRYRKALSQRQTLFLLSGVLLIVIGIFYAESNQYSFQVGTIPFIIAISGISGVGYYAQFYKIKRYSIGSKLIFQPLFFVPVAVLFFVISGMRGFSYGYFALGLFGGFVFILASLSELKAMKMSDRRKASKSVVLRNFINDFGYLDTLFVLIGSVIIGSFYPVELFGGIFILIGILLIGRLI
ncbi:MAG: hypothetical protein M1544_00835 [Candidatus Marsarchaeota archaeon]|nr:hypothetical protein [Candidatus Marsarchaeota archaeon]